MITSFQILVFGVLFIYAFNRLTRWMHRRGWIRWRMRRGTSSGLGNAVLGVQMIFQPPIRDVLEIRMEEPSEAGESGDPPDPGTDPGAWETPIAADDRRERGHVPWFKSHKGYGRITSDEFNDVLFVHFSGIRGESTFRDLREGQNVEYSRQIHPGPHGARAVAVDVVVLPDAADVNVAPVS